MEPHVLNWCCGEHPFRLRIGEAEALDDATNDGIADLLYRLQMGRARGSFAYSPVRTRELVDCIRLGLIGGGMDGAEARKLALRSWEEGDFGELVVLCITVLGVAMSGKDHDQPGKPEAAVAAKKSGSSSRRSTGTGRSSATRRSKSKK